MVLGGCNYLDDFSQSQTIVKSVTSLDEVLLGEVYMPSINGMKHIANGDAGWWLQLLDDDINTVSWNNSSTNGDFVSDYYNTPMNYNYFGYTTWQMEVGRSYDGKQLNVDDILWTSFYRRINVCNIILSTIDNLEITTDDDVAASLRVRGEAYAMRAYYYFYLANIYANAYEPGKAETTLGVPLKLTDYVEHDKEKDTQFERTPLSEVYAQIVDDLKTALYYLEQSPKPSSYYRITEKAARLLLSRVYLYMQDWDNARIEAEKLLTENGGVSLQSYASDIEKNGVIWRDNKEILFSQGSLNVQNYTMGAKLGGFCISQDLYSLYDDADYRKTKYFALNEATDSIALSTKYQQGSTIQSYVSDIYLLRSSEAYLNMAEACAESGKEDKALQWLNRFRHYRIMGYVDQSYSGEELINQIRTERRKEFCVEGQRWFDLRRYAVNVLHPYKRTIDRVYTVYNDGGNVALRNETYRLDIDDPAYTFAIPKSVIEFDKVPMPDNVRKVREPIATSIPVAPEEDEDENENEGGE